MESPVVHAGEVFIVGGDLDRATLTSSTTQSELYPVQGAGPRRWFVVPEDTAPGPYVLKSHRLELPIEVTPARVWRTDIARPEPLDVVLSRRLLAAPCGRLRSEADTVVARWRVPRPAEDVWTVQMPDLLWWDDAVVLGDSEILEVVYELWPERDRVCPELTLRDPRYLPVWNQRYVCVRPSRMTREVPPLVPIGADVPDPERPVATQLLRDGGLGGALMAAVLAATSAVRHLRERQARPKEAGPAGP